MKTTYSLKNFRVFDEDGASFDMTPITILTGCNSSGKSSVVKSMMLLKECIRKAYDQYSIKSKFNPAECYIDFSAKGLNLKSFESSVNRKSENRSITLSYSAVGIVVPYKVELVFSEKDGDIFNRGWLSQINLLSSDGKHILTAKKQDDKCFVVDYLDVNGPILSEFHVFAWAMTLYHIDKELEKCRDSYGDIIDEEQYDEWETQKKRLIDTLEGRQEYQAIVAVYQKLCTEPTIYDYSEKFKHNFEKPLEYMRNDNILFYFPVMEQLRGLDKSGIRKVLENAKSYDMAQSEEWFRDTAVKIADAFEQSDYESFLDFYSELENEELDDVVRSQKHQHMLVNMAENLISAIGGDIAAIRYDTNNNIHFLADYAKNEVNFNMVYKFLSCWQIGVGNMEDFIKSYGDHNGCQSSHILYDACTDFLSLMLEKVLFPDIFNRLEYIGNFQSEVRRLYNFDDYSNNLGNTIKSFLENKAKFENQRSVSFGRTSADSYRPGDFTNKWIKKLKIGNSLNIIEDEDKLGAKLYIRKDSKKQGYPLADEGYGISQLVTFLLHIENEILINKISTDLYKLNEGKEIRAVATLSLEEPEVSLHPSMQSLLADVLYDAYRSYGIHFIIETHSEYLIRRTQAIVAKYKTSEEFESKPFSVYYIAQGGKAYRLEYTESGRFNNNFGKGFFDEASRSSLEILKREKHMRYE